MHLWNVSLTHRIFLIAIVNICMSGVIPEYSENITPHKMRKLVISLRNKSYGKVGPHYALLSVVSKLANAVYFRLQQLVSKNHHKNRVTNDLKLVFLGKNHRRIKTLPINLVSKGDLDEDLDLKHWHEVLHSTGIEHKIMSVCSQRLDNGSRKFKYLIYRTRYVALEAQLSKPTRIPNWKLVSDVKEETTNETPRRTFRELTNNKRLRTGVPEHDPYLPATENQLRVMRGLEPLKGSKQMEEDIKVLEDKLQTNPEKFKQTKIEDFFKPRSSLMRKN